MDNEGCQKMISGEEEKIEMKNNFTDQCQSSLVEKKVPGIEYSFGTFSNWFMPSCMDFWSSSFESIIGYGARSFLFLLDVKRSEAKNSSRLMVNEINYSIEYRDLVNVFGHTANKKDVDIFRKTNSYITTVVFDKSKFSENRPRVFIGNSDGLVALYDISKCKSTIQDLPFSAIKSQCCKNVSQTKILSATWLHFKSIGSIVFYTLDHHLIRWEVDNCNEFSVSVQHNQKSECNQPGCVVGQFQVSCLSSMSAEFTQSKSEHKLAVGFMGGKIIIFGFDHVSGEQTSFTIISENAHSDDICSLSFSNYSIASSKSYSSGLLCSVSRDSVLKVWSCSNLSELAEFRINNQQIRSNINNNKNEHNRNESKCNWFSAAFVPYDNLQQQQTGKSKCSISYELIVTSPNGELVTITIPEREPNSKIRIAKASKFSTKANCHSHQSVVFSIITDSKLSIAVTYSLDYKMLLWDLNQRSPKATFHMFTNGALSIDNCHKDRRSAVAFGNSIYILDFDVPDNHQMKIQVSRCATATKNWKFYQVAWNQISDSERLGSIAIGNSLGEVLLYDLNELSFTVKHGNKFHQKSGDSSKIYKFVWPVKFPVWLSQQTGPQFRLVILSLHASGSIMVNYLPSKNVPNCSPEKFINPKFVSGMDTNQQQKNTAIDQFHDGEFLIIGNDDGTVDVLKANEITDKMESPIYRHLFRFRAFNKPIISVEVGASSNNKNSFHLAVTSLNDHFVLCYQIDEEHLFSQLAINEETAIRNIHPDRIKLSGHKDRISACNWNPFDECLLLVTASYDTTCIIWDVQKQAPLKQFFGHRSLIYSIRWSHFNPNLILSGGEDCFHCWDWTKQPNYESDCNHNVNSHVTIQSLKTILNVSEDRRAKNENVKTSKVSKVTRGKNNISQIESINQPFSTNHMLHISSKPLFSISNQIENNSSKYDILDDIKWIVKLKKFYHDNSDDQITYEIIPEHKLSRIFLYGSLNEIQVFIKNESDNHLSNNQMDAYYMISMIGDLRKTIENLIENGESDLILASMAIPLSHKLYKQSVETHLKQLESTGGKLVPNRSQRLFVAYPQEMKSLCQLYCLGSISLAVENLIKSSLFREAIVLSKVHRASDQFVNEIWNQWFQFRLSQGNYEGAIKCLVASDRMSEAIQYLEQRMTLCLDTSAQSVIKQYSETIDFLKSMS